MGGPAVAADHRLGLIPRWACGWVGYGEAESAIQTTQHNGHPRTPDADPAGLHAWNLAAVLGNTPTAVGCSHFSTRTLKRNILA